jgi:MYXO-CTERM domain-containing protein
MRGSTIVLVAALAAASLPAAASAQVLRNDGFESGGQAGFQGGFVAGEIAASTLIAPGPAQVQTVQLLFGGASSTQEITLRVWDDTAATTAPGAMIYEGDFQLMGSNTAMQEIDLSGMNVFVPARFRVGILFQHAGLPSVARDADGTITADRNYILAIVGGNPQWFRSQTLGLTGDWIIRAVVNGGGTPDAGTGPDASVGPDAGTGEPDAGTGEPDAGTGECDGNSDCPLGEYCDTNVGACTFDCRADDDCGGAGTCNSLGQCLDGEGDGGGGCCSTSGATGGAGDAPWGALGLAAMIGLALTRRRRS